MAARSTRRIISRCMTLPPYFQRDPFAMRLVQTTFSYARGPSLFSQGSLPCSAKAQAPMVVADETKLSPTGCAAVLQLGHETLRRFGFLHHKRACLANAAG